MKFKYSNNSSVSQNIDIKYIVLKLLFKLLTLTTIQVGPAAFDLGCGVPSTPFNALLNTTNFLDNGEANVLTNQH